MTDRNVFRMVVFHTPRGRLSETRGLSEGPVITELPDDFEVDNVKAVKGVKDSSNDSNDNIDTNTDIAANALANDENALDYNARAKLVENKQSGRAYTDLVDNEETGEKTDDKCTPKHEDRHTHFTLGFQFTTKDLPSKHPSNFIRSNDRFTNDPKKHDTKELEIESPTGPESDFNDSSKPLVSANRNGNHLFNVSAYHPDAIHNTDSFQEATAFPKQNAWNATFGDNDHKNRSERACVEPFVHSGPNKPVTANDAHRIEDGTSQHGHSNQGENDEQTATCPTFLKQKYCKHKEIKEMRVPCINGCHLYVLMQCTNCKKEFSEEELLTLTEKRSAKLNKNAIPKKSERSFVEDNETPKKPSTKETPVARSNKNYSTRRKNEEADRLLETKHCVQSEARRDLNDFGNGGPVEDSRSV
ncbi:uncharacterized protein LOC127860067 isoform X4 [Dreissena polymorpha]|uniref:Uncharacterized protein n=1 Tax=Dreissena polymorpha TaxID=45954 RepID=A0A9D4BQC9_DREPO|nr:uncharacterized protein LOC127860067 isoform X4 [Dreissena polymorpha]XP_052253814.1 uncharacterized protein LOC127860067 isoform X4 [Dreissena polymorpha]XP_052253815.1 uncharacterized protein LOC127860067 isoform X4 [Dreissena polymorpha]XP_052253816.1 uncharacterized protein LOC127860067 isoform X4 [Dreissena polymorpha]XP_052253817.1 uncharacterized protein LOC127860067 isoform X4 [Dreissena polymorpha]KAH3701297.1 hypothetical protein DPMN_076280 [Dreissena polymorpha]